MTVFRSQAQPDMVHAFFTERDVEALIEALKKPKNESARELRRQLKKAAK